MSSENDDSTRFASSLELGPDPDCPMPEDRESLVQCDESVAKIPSSQLQIDAVATAEKEPLHKRASAEKIDNKSSTATPSQTEIDPVMSKFKLLLQKYNNAMKSITQEQLSLKCTFEQLSKLKKELQDTGKYPEDLLINSPKLHEVPSFHCQLSSSCGETQTAETGEEASSFEVDKLRLENRKLAMKLSELERKVQSGRTENLKKSMSKVSVRPTTPQTQEYVISKELRSNIRSRNALRLEYERKLDEANAENDRLRNQLRENETAVEELSRMNSFVSSEREMMERQLAEAKASLDGKIKESKKYEDFSQLVQISLTRLRGEYAEFQKENDSLRAVIEELKRDYVEVVERVQTASKSWKTTDAKYREQERVKNAIISDFVKLGVSYKKLRASLADLTRRNAELEQQAGHARKSRDNASSKCSRSCKVSKIKRTRVSDRGNISVHAVGVNSNPLSKLTAFVNKKLSSQQFSSGGKPLRKSMDEKDESLVISRKQRPGLQIELKAAREENARFAGKHKLLMKQLLRYEKRCHLQSDQNRKHGKIVGEPQSRDLSVINKHPTDQLPDTGEAETSVKPRNPNPPKSSKPRGHHRMVYVVRPASLTKTSPSKKPWLGHLWCKDGNQTINPPLN